MKIRETTVHCFCTKLETLERDYEDEHGPDTFVGSDVWRATLAREWEDGVCRLPADHISEHAFEPIVRSKRERKAS
jgi:hypothetical protein